jgi:hypothetical protein
LGQIKAVLLPEKNPGNSLFSAQEEVLQRVQGDKEKRERYRLLFEGIKRTEREIYRRRELRNDFHICKALLEQYARLLNCGVKDVEWFAYNHILNKAKVSRSLVNDILNLLDEQEFQSRFGDLENMPSRQKSSIRSSLVQVAGDVWKSHSRRPLEKNTTFSARLIVLIQQLFAQCRQQQEKRPKFLKRQVELWFEIVKDSDLRNKEASKLLLAMWKSDPELARTIVKGLPFEILQKTISDTPELATFLETSQPQKSAEEHFRLFTLNRLKKLSDSELLILTNYLMASTDWSERLAFIKDAKADSSDNPLWLRILKEGSPDDGKSFLESLLPDH